jgi:plasmid replication initiation protein
MDWAMATEKRLRKHVAIIHAYSLMSALQRKIMNILLYEAVSGNKQIKSEGCVAIESRISFANLAKAVNFNSNNTKYLKEAIDGLASIKIEWNLLKDKVPTEIAFLNLRVLHGAPTFYQDATFNFSFHKVMLDLVGNPPVYGSIDLEIQSQFESKYGLSLYENSTRFVNLQKNKIIQLDLFRKLLGVNEDKYTNIRELTRNVISPALEEVNDRADFEVKLDAIKMGRKITGFELSVTSKKTTASVHENSGSTKENLMSQIKQHFGNIVPHVLANILKSYSEEYIIEKMLYTVKHAKKDFTGNYPVPYFISALKNDYKSTEQVEKNTVPTFKIADIMTLWKEKWVLLRDDLVHWKKLEEFAIANNNSFQIKNTQTIITQCEEKLREHLLVCPEQEEKKV